MFNLTVGDLLVYIFATICLMVILGLGATRLANSGKGKLSVLVFTLFLFVSTTNLLAYHSLQSAEKYMGWYAGIHLAFWLLCAGVALMHNERLKRVGMTLAAIGSAVGVGVVIYVLRLLIIA